MTRAIDRHVDHARAEAERARERAISTIAEVRYRLSPRTIAAETVEQAWVHVAGALEEVAGAAKSRPWVLAGIATLVGLALSWRATTSETEIDATNADA